MCCGRLWSSSFQQQLAVMFGKNEAGARGMNFFEVFAVPLGARRASRALFVEPGELVLQMKDKPAVEQKHRRQRHLFNVQANVSLGQEDLTLFLASFYLLIMTDDLFVLLTVTGVSGLLKLYPIIFGINK